MDASIRLQSNNFTKVFRYAVASDGLVFFRSTGISNYAVTHPTMYEFLPTLQSRQKKTAMHCGGIILVYNTRSIFHNVLRWWLLCAAEEKCIVPIPRTACNLSKKSPMETFANCHRFEQSCVNVLVSNYHGYNASIYSVPNQGLISVERWPTNHFKIQTV